MDTRLQYHEDSALMELQVRILRTGMDALGTYFIPDKTIFYPGGGGQPQDEAWLIGSQGKKIPILKAATEDHSLKHYYPATEDSFQEGILVAMEINPETRLLHSRIHTGGHLVSSLVYEYLKWPLIPVKGYHYPDSPYVEMSNLEGMSSFPVSELDAGLREAIKKDLPVHISADGSLDGDRVKTFIPPGFQLAAGKSLRWVGIEGFRYYPCAGTHTRSTGVLSRIHIKYCKGKKGNIRIAYQVD